MLFVNFDAGDNWLAKLAGDDQQVADNLEPLQGLGMSAWQSGDAGHALLPRSTTLRDRALGGTLHATGQVRHAVPRALAHQSDWSALPQCGRACQVPQVPGQRARVPRVPGRHVQSAHKCPVSGGRGG